MKRYEKASDIKVGVVGYGGAFNMGKHHLESMKAAGMTPKAVCEVDPARLEVAGKDYPGIETYSKVEEMLAKSSVDLIVLITPHNTHAPLAIAALNAGKHVVCEKPFAITTAECDAMIAAAEKSGVMLSTFHNRHWDGCVLNAVKQLEAGTIGEIFRIEVGMGGYGKPGDWWRSSKSISGGILYDWGVHLLEYSLQLIKSDLAEVSGFAKIGYWADQTKWKADTNEDEGFAVARFTNGKWITLRISAIDSKPSDKFLTATGTKGTMSLDWNAAEIVQHKDGQTVTTRIPHPPGEGQKFYNNVAAHLTTGEALVITPQWARRPIHVLDLACQSAAKGTAIKATYK
ncbi:MAG: Gfo/Idh/MocA family oxidoreductase [Planctomycetota bacterium]|nr:Gfo/Idh/MocA family oxidoreductase [Planctomycetota bacterium]